MYLLNYWAHYMEPLRSTLSRVVVVVVDVVSCGHRCAGGVRQWRRAIVATPGEWQCKTARSGEWAQNFSNASC